MTHPAHTHRHRSDSDGQPIHITGKGRTLTLWGNLALSLVVVAVMGVLTVLALRGM